MADEYDVVVIGAGLSGLVAAYSVLKEMPSAKVAVLEASGKKILNIAREESFFHLEQLCTVILIEL